MGKWVTGAIVLKDARSRLRVLSSTDTFVQQR